MVKKYTGSSEKNNNTGNFGKNKNSGKKGGYSRSNRRQTPSGNKQNSALLSEKPKYIAKKHHVVSRDADEFVMKYTKPGKIDASVFGGNLPAKSLSGSCKTDSLIKSNSPEVFSGKSPVRIIPMGGMNEVGLNMTAIEYEDDIIIVDTGFGFGGGEKYPGVDYIIPDTAYLEQNRHKIRGLIYTHAHLDHIGGAPYILPKLGDIPIFGTQFTLALLKNRLQEFELENKFVAKIIDLDRSLKLGSFSLQFFRLNHSVPDVVGLGIDTPMGRIMYCTDWKFDHTPYDNEPSDYAKIAKMGDEGVRLLMTDALGALKSGYAASERDIEKEVLSIFPKCAGRIIFTTFASNVARMQHVINACVKTNRKLVLVGRSMVTNFNVSFTLGKLKVPANLVVDIRKSQSLPPEKVVILCTGSQGEDNAALSRMVRDEHQQVKLQGGDAVLFSSSPIPGNEESVQDLMSGLTKKGVDVYYKPYFNLHVSGHACEEDLKVLFSMSKPDYLQPIHGEHFMLKKAAELGAYTGIPEDHCLIGANGRITEMRQKEVVVTDEVITENYYLVDGSGIGAVSEVVLEERRTMNNDGVLILVMILNKKKKLVSGPEIISRGFVYMKNSTVLFDDIKTAVRGKFNSLDIDPTSKTYFSELRKALRTIASNYVFEKTEKMPMIIPVVVQV